MPSELKEEEEEEHQLVKIIIATTTATLLHDFNSTQILVNKLYHLAYYFKFTLALVSFSPISEFTIVITIVSLLHFMVTITFPTQQVGS